jgi:hypothetical protein
LGLSNLSAGTAFCCDKSSEKAPVVPASNLTNAFSGSGEVRRALLHPAFPSDQMSAPLVDGKQNTWHLKTAMEMNHICRPATFMKVIHVLSGDGNLVAKTNHLRPH